MCIAAIREQQNLDPLFKIWHHFASYKFINDAEFLREFVTLVYIIYHQLCNEVVAAGDVRNQPSVEEVLDLYEKISQLPIPELLNALDAVIDQFIDIMEEYEMQASMDWWTWLKKYWWIPPTIVVSLVIKMGAGFFENAYS
jgi:hypothetical protein